MDLSLIPASYLDPEAPGALCCFAVHGRVAEFLLNLLAECVWAWQNGLRREREKNKNEAGPPFASLKG